MAHAHVPFPSREARQVVWASPPCTILARAMQPSNVGVPLPVPPGLTRGHLQPPFALPKGMNCNPSPSPSPSAPTDSTLHRPSDRPHTHALHLYRSKLFQTLLFCSNSNNPPHLTQYALPDVQY